MKLAWRLRATNSSLATLMFSFFHFLVLNFTLQQRCERLASAPFVYIGSGVTIVLGDEVSELLVELLFFELVVWIGEG